MTMLTLNDGRAELWQWDTGRTLAVDADCSQVHFSNKVFGRSIDVDIVDGAAIIPDVLLQTDKDLYVWAFVGTAENGYTKISKTFKVNRRNKPADYVFTPPEQTTLSELTERLDKIEESQDPDAIKNAVNDYLEQNPVESPVKSVNGKTGAVELTANDVGAISRENLQEATNDALAQAKKSGEFDGPQGPAGPQGPQGEIGPVGATPNIQIGTVETLAAGSPATASMGGTPENPLLNLGIPQGAPGSGGSGIAVSGATVGQTVKISAVDDDGVPTAWEAVDFPNGGGGEADPPLLVDYTVPDDSTASIIKFTSDDNGIAFNLNNRCYFVVDAIFPDSTSKTIGITSNGSNQGAGPFSPGNRTSVTVTELHIFGKYTRDFGTRYTTWVQYRPSVNYGYPASSSSQFGQSDLALLMENTSGTAVKSLMFAAMGTGDTIYWAPGTRVRIWGD